MTIDEVAPGLVVVDKPGGWTSHDVVARGRRLAGTRKVGHAGTLDPMATGVLVLAVGRATRLLGHLQLTDKEYLATIRLGESTVTDDAEGDVTARTDVGGLSRADVETAVEPLTGDIAQVPSSVSAIKVDGQRSYARVRSGEPVELAARPVTVSAFDVLDVHTPSGTGADDVGGVLDVDVHVACSSGTYVRALARDLGAGLGVGGHLTALRRTRVGPFTLESAHTLDALAHEWRILDIDDAARAAFPTIGIDAERATAVGFGRRLPGLALPADGPVALFAPDGRFLALYRRDGEDAAPVAVFAPA